VQIFQQNYLIFSSLDNSSNALPALTEPDQPFSFHVGVKVVNDVLIRLRHYHSEEQRDSVCRVYFNTSFIADNYLRVNKVSF
jgi:C2 domain of PTEN tumour-suppressor protein